MIIQQYLNKELVSALDEIFAGGSSIPVDGLNMNGAINMNNNPLQNVRDPASDHEAINLGYAKANFITSSRKINGKPLTGDITLNADDVNARSSTWLPSISEIGAAPGSYGLGKESAKAITNLDDAKESGWYMVNASATNAPIKAYDGAMLVVSRDANTKAQTIYYAAQEGVMTYTRRMRGGVWGAWVNTSPSAFAPSGHGLGKSVNSDIQTITDCNACRANGWYRCRGASNGPVPNGGGTGYYGWLLVSTGDFTRQDFYTSTSDPIHFVRYYVDGWSPWELVAPPFSSGVEYRTTERIHGKVVFQKADSKGSIMHRLDGETIWHGHTTTTTLWVNASPTSLFDAQTVTLFDNWSNYYAIGIQFSDGYTEMLATSGSNCQIVTAFPATDANNNVMVHYRWARLVNNGVQFDAGYYLTVNGQWTANDRGVPQKIYGIKGVS